MLVLFQIVYVCIFKPLYVMMSQSDKNKTSKADLEDSAHTFDIVFVEMKSYVKRKTDLQYLADFTFYFCYEGLDSSNNLLHVLSCQYVDASNGGVLSEFFIPLSKSQLGRSGDVYPVLANAVKNVGCWINESLFKAIHGHLWLLDKLEEFQRQDPR